MIESKEPFPKIAKGTESDSPCPLILLKTEAVIPGILVISLLTQAIAALDPGLTLEDICILFISHHPHNLFTGHNTF